MSKFSENIIKQDELKRIYEREIERIGGKYPMRRRNTEGDK